MFHLFIPENPTRDVIIYLIEQMCNDKQFFLVYQSNDRENDGILLWSSYKKTQKKWYGCIGTFYIESPTNYILHRTKEGYYVVTKYNIYKGVDVSNDMKKCLEDMAIQRLKLAMYSM